MSVSSGFVVNGSNVSKVLYDGDSAYDVDVRGKASLIVSGGAYVEDAVVRTSAIIDISERAVVSSLAISVGSGYVSSGGLLTDARLSSKSLLIVFSGGTAVDLDVAGGNVNVDVYGDDSETVISGRNESGTFSFSGGVASNFIIHSRGVQWVYSGALTSDITIGKGGNLYVSSGGSAIGVKQDESALVYANVYGGDAATVIRGSNANGEFFLSNGIAYNFLVTTGGMQNVYSGGIASGTVANGLRAQVIVYSGGSIHDASIGMNASLTLYRDTVGADVCISSGAHVDVHGGSLVSDMSIYGNAVFASATAGADEVSEVTETTISGMYVGETGVVSFSNDIILSGVLTIDGSVSVLNGKTITLDFAGHLNADAAMISDWSKITWSNINLHVDVGESFSGGIYKLAGNASAFTSTITVCSGTSPLFTISPGGEETFGDISCSLSCGADEILTLTALETLNDVVLTNSSLAVSAYVVANRTIAGNWGIVSVTSGGTANSTTVENWGYLYLSGGVAFDTVANRYGWVHVHSDGAASRTTVTRLGMMYVHEDGDADGTTVDGGYLAVSTGGRVSNTSVIGGGRVYVSSGAAADSTTVGAGGSLYVSSGGTAANVAWTPGVGHVYAVDGAEVTYAVSFGGVYYGGQNSSAVSGQTVSSGDMYVMDGGSAEATVVRGATLQIWNDGSAEASIVGSDGDVYVSRGGVADNTTVNSRGETYVYSSGSVVSTTVNDCGCLYVSAGGTAESTVLNSGGSAIIFSGAFADGITVNEYGRLDIFSGGNAVDIAIVAGGELGGFCFADDKHLDEVVDGSAFVEENIYIVDSRMFVISGGVASMSSIRGGVLNIASGGTVTGKLNIAADAVVSAFQGSTIDFDLTDVSVVEPALVNDLSRISGAPEYTVTVTADQQGGVYRLAEGATEFDETLTVNSEAGVLIGRVAVGGKVSYAERTYLLSNDGGTLSLTVTERSAAGKATRGDLNGNGISDILFQNLLCPLNPLGAWMDADMARWNGSLGSAPLEEWTVCGAYDFTGDGVCDILFRNRLASAGYAVGFSDMGDGGTFRTIGTGVSTAWDIAQVGDFNGNGVADILWRNGSTGRYGLWVDGSAEWVALSEDGLSSGSVIGVGDFDGDGCDDLLVAADGVFGAWDISGIAAGRAGAPRYAAFGIELDSSWSVVGAADFDGNGLADIVVREHDAGGVGAYMNGDPDRFVEICRSGQLGCDISGFGDYNGDGGDDILVRDLATGALGYWSGKDGFAWNAVGVGIDSSWAVIA